MKGNCVITEDNTIIFPTSKHKDVLFKCPNCEGWHFNITNGGELLCTTRKRESEGFGCGWSGQIVMKEGK